MPNLLNKSVLILSILQVTIIPNTCKTSSVWNLWIYSDATKRLSSLRQCIQEVSCMILSLLVVEISTEVCAIYIHYMSCDSSRIEKHFRQTNLVFQQMHTSVDISYTYACTHTHTQTCACTCTHAHSSCTVCMYDVGVYFS